MKPLGVALALALACALCQAVPGVLIAQIPIEKAARADIFKRVFNRAPGRDWEPGLLDLPSVNMLANEIHQEGRVFAVVWALSDPMIRAAIEEGKIKEVAQNPSLNLLQDARNKLRCDYVLLVTAWREGEVVLASARLLNGRREIWRDDRQMTGAVGGQFNGEMVAESLARTWSQLLNGSAFKDLPPKLTVRQPDAEPGVKPPDGDKPNVKPAPNNQVIQDAMKLLAGGKGPQAIDMLRDAVDAEPLNVERRQALIQVCAQLGRHLEAAHEARRAALLFPERPELHVLAARAWLGAGKPDEALTELNEAVAHDPDAFETRLLLGELQLKQLRFSFAIEHFSKALDKSPNSEAFWQRGLAKMFEGNGSGGKADWEAAAQADPTPSETAMLARYRLASGIFPIFIEGLGSEIRIQLPLAKSNPKDSAVKLAVADIERRAVAALGVWEALTAPAANQRSHDRFGLALKLLRQSTSELTTLLQTASEDDMAQASITLGEALRQLKDARKALEAEQTAP
ncbi:MAG: tetratricopeptide repeat protein [Armatimonadetes bacterium]|nr:tetratricopeptide repeat protein [Armatimonadota bacterium]